MCSVADAGTGIANEILDKVFEPFFTTKEVGKGSGLGLSQVLGVVKQLGGGVASNRVRGWAQLSMCIYPAPAAAASPSRIGRSNRALIPKKRDFRRAVVLVVDDDAEVRAATAEMLRYAGHEVVEAEGGREALDCLDREGDRIDLMIVDYVMPGMNGVETRRLGRLRRPRLPIMFMTGFADTAVLAAEASADLILQKPFYTADLVAKIEEVLGSASKRFAGSAPPTTC